LRDETKAVSDMAKSPLRRVSAMIIAIWSERLIILGSVHSRSAPLVTPGKGAVALEEAEDY
jgi:hypothetical protein